MKIREAVFADAERIAAVHVQSWREAYKGIIYQEFLDRLDVQNRIVFWKKRLKTEEEGKYDLVAVQENGEIVGFASFGKAQPNIMGIESELFAIYILQTHKRNGIGTALLSVGIEKLQEEGVNSLLVRVLEDNPGRKFYENFMPFRVAVEKDTMGSQELNVIVYGWMDLSNLVRILNEKS